MSEGGITRNDLDECWCCGGLHDAAGALCPACKKADCKHFYDECLSDHKPVLPDGGQPDGEVSQIDIKRARIRIEDAMKHLGSGDPNHYAEVDLQRAHAMLGGDKNDLYPEGESDAR